MGSKTKKLESIRKQKARNCGAKRKAALRSNGTTQTPEKLFGDE